MQSDRASARATHLALVDAMAGEHRLRRQALKERQEVERWAQRVIFADERGLSDMAAAARSRATRHAQQASLLTERADELQAEVRLLREAPPATRGAGRAPPRSLEARFLDLELETEIERIRAAKRVGPSSLEHA